MVLTPCEACNCIPGNESTLTWQQKVRLTLCSILNALGGGGVGSALTNIDAVEIAHGSITNAYAPLSFLTADGEAKSIAVFNNTNHTIQISYDGVTDGPIVPAGVFRQIDFTANGRTLYSTDIFIKYTGSAPTNGSVFIDGFY